MIKFVSILFLRYERKVKFVIWKFLGVKLLLFTKLTVFFFFAIHIFMTEYIKNVLIHPINS